MSAKCIETAQESRKMAITLVKTERFFDALICFNKSLCFSPPGSSALANAYQQRAILYMKVQLFDKCLENLQKALDCKHPKPELIETLQAECLESMKTNGNSTYKAPKFELSHPANEKLPFIVDCLEFRKDGKGHPHVFTTKDLKVGDVVALVEPISPILNGDQVYQRCSYCCKDNSLDLDPCLFCVKGEKMSVKIIFDRLLNKHFSIQQCTALRNAETPLTNVIIFVLNARS